MKACYSLGRWWQVDVKIHWSLLILLAVAVASSLGHGIWSAALSVVLLAGLLFSIVLHEYAHAFAGRVYGIHTKAIVLSPIGGTAILENEPPTARAETVVAAAGPAMSLFLAATTWGLSHFVPGMIGAVFFDLFLVNLVLALFNLLPIFPSDGGRIFRAFLSRSMDIRYATAIALQVSRVLSVGLALFALVYQRPMMLLVAGFLFFVATKEFRALGPYALNFGQIRQRFVIWFRRRS